MATRTRATLRVLWRYLECHGHTRQVYAYLAACIFDVPLYRAAPASHGHGLGSRGGPLELAAGTGWLALLLPPLLLALLDTYSDATSAAARRRRPWVVAGLSVFGLAWPPAAWALGYYGRDRIVHVGLPELGFILASVRTILRGLSPDPNPNPNPNPTPTPTPAPIQTSTPAPTP